MGGKEIPEMMDDPERVSPAFCNGTSPTILRYCERLIRIKFHFCTIRWPNGVDPILSLLHKYQNHVYKMSPSQQHELHARLERATSGTELLDDCPCSFSNLAATWLTQTSNLLAPAPFYFLHPDIILRITETVNGDKKIN